MCAWTSTLGDRPASPPAEAPKAAAEPRRRLVWLIVAGALVLGAGIGAGATIFLLRDDEDTTNRPWVPPAADSPAIGNNEYRGEDAIQRYRLDRGGRQPVIAFFDGDDPDLAMQQAAEVLDEDDRIDWVKTETRQEAYERFTEIFADQPELAEMARPEALPASVTLLPADDVYPGDLADAITDRFSTIDSVSAGGELRGSAAIARPATPPVPPRPHRAGRAGWPPARGRTVTAAARRR